jgi:hypothetical protein
VELVPPLGPVDSPLLDEQLPNSKTKPQAVRILTTIAILFLTHNREPRADARRCRKQLSASAKFTEFLALWIASIQSGIWT